MDRIDIHIVYTHEADEYLKEKPEKVDLAGKVLLICYAIDNKEVQVIDLSENDLLPDEFINAITDMNVVKCCFYADNTIYMISQITNIPIPNSNWIDLCEVIKFFDLPVLTKYRGKILEYDCSELSKAERIFTGVNKYGERNMPEDFPKEWNNYKAMAKEYILLVRKAYDKYYLSSAIEQKAIWVGIDARTKIRNKKMRVDSCRMKELYYEKINSKNEMVCDFCSEVDAFGNLNEDEARHLLRGDYNAEIIMDFLERKALLNDKEDMYNVFEKEHEEAVQQRELYEIFKTMEGKSYIINPFVSRENIDMFLEDIFIFDNEKPYICEYTNAQTKIKKWIAENLEGKKFPFTGKNKWEQSGYAAIIYKSIIYCMLTGRKVDLGVLSVFAEKGQVYLKLPSGRAVAYAFYGIEFSVVGQVVMYRKKVINGKKAYVNKNRNLKKIVALLEWDLLREKMENLYKQGVDILLDGRSYLVVDIPDAKTEEKVRIEMEKTPAWYRGEKLNVSVDEGGNKNECPEISDWLDEYLD